MTRRLRRHSPRTASPASHDRQPMSDQPASTSWAGELPHQFTNRAAVSEPAKDGATGEGAAEPLSPNPITNPGAPERTGFAEGMGNPPAYPSAISSIGGAL